MNRFNTRIHEVSEQSLMNVHLTENPECLCPESTSYLGIIPIYLFIRQIYPECLLCARPCDKSCGDTDRSLS